MPLEDHAPCLAPIVDVKNAKRPIRPCGCAIRRGGDYCERHAKHKAGFDALRGMLRADWTKGREVGREAAQSVSTQHTSTPPTPAPIAPSPTAPTPKRGPTTPPVTVDFMSWGRNRDSRG
jgi:hypothetical protein